MNEIDLTYCCGARLQYMDTQSYSRTETQRQADEFHKVHAACREAWVKAQESISPKTPMDKP